MNINLVSLEMHFAKTCNDCERYELNWIRTLDLQRTGKLSKQGNSSEIVRWLQKVQWIHALLEYTLNPAFDVLLVMVFESLELSREKYFIS